MLNALKLLCADLCVKMVQYLGLSFWKQDAIVFTWLFLSFHCSSIPPLKTKKPPNKQTKTKKERRKRKKKRKVGNGKVFTKRRIQITSAIS